jgi:hypothetical protein
LFALFMTLTKPNVARAIEDAKADWLARTDTDGDSVRRDIAAAANLDYFELFDAKDNFIPVRSLPPHVGKEHDYDQKEVGQHRYRRKPQIVGLKGEIVAVCTIERRCAQLNRHR